jgi:hypothetical protein
MRPLIGHDSLQGVGLLEGSVNTNPGRRIASTLVLGIVLSFAAAQAQPSSPPPLVPCDAAAERMPCVEIVTEVGAIVGTWRRYILDATSPGYTVYRGDGTLSVLSILPGDGRPTGTIRFEDGVASIAPAPTQSLPPECDTPGLYEVRLIRFGEHPVALSFSRVAEDRCLARANLMRPMVFYGGSGEEFAIVRNQLELPPPLVPCPEQVDEPYPCDLVVTRAEDVAGIWKQYLSDPDLQAPDGVGYQRIGHDGRFIIADTLEDTAAAFGNYTYGTYDFRNRQVWLTVDAPDVPEPCKTGVQRFHVYRYGLQPVALLVVPLLDHCTPRLHDLRLPLIWVADAD